jgi:hypothetical protein
MPETDRKSSQRRGSDETLPEELAPQRKNSMAEADIEDKREPENPATAVLWEGGDKDKAGLRFGPKAAAHLKVRKYQESLVNKEVTVGSLWVDRPVSSLFPSLIIDYEQTDKQTEFRQTHGLTMPQALRQAMHHRRR